MLKRWENALRGVHPSFLSTRTQSKGEWERRRGSGGLAWAEACRCTSVSALILQTLGSGLFVAWRHVWKQAVARASLSVRSEIHKYSRPSGGEEPATPSGSLLFLFGAERSDAAAAFAQWLSWLRSFLTLSLTRMVYWEFNLFWRQNPKRNTNIYSRVNKERLLITNNWFWP